MEALHLLMLVSRLIESGPRDPGETRFSETLRRRTSFLPQKHCAGLILAVANLGELWLAPHGISKAEAPKSRR
jgi:hypothetical protein